ncbi:hypothetical protein BGX29_005683, partial [Mortierella sp. GBA35]
MSTSSSPYSLRMAQGASDEPIWTHTKSTQVNHELNHLRILWHTINDVPVMEHPSIVQDIF